jgi:hypothetical protein
MPQEFGNVALPSKGEIRETGHFKEGLTCLDVPRTRALVSPLGTIPLSGRKHHLLPSPSTTTTCGHGRGEAILVCLDC